MDYYDIKAFKADYKKGQKVEYGLKDVLYGGNTKKIDVHILLSKYKYNHQSIYIIDDIILYNPPHNASHRIYIKELGKLDASLIRNAFDRGGAFPYTPIIQVSCIILEKEKKIKQISQYIYYDELSDMLNLLRHEDEISISYTFKLPFPVKRLSKKEHDAMSNLNIRKNFSKGERKKFDEELKYFIDHYAISDYKKKHQISELTHKMTKMREYIDTMEDNMADDGMDDDYGEDSKDNVWKKQADRVRKQMKNTFKEYKKLGGSRGWETWWDH